MSTARKGGGKGIRPCSVGRETGLSWLGIVPEHWEVRRLKSLVRDVNEQKSTKDEDEIYVALEQIESWTGSMLPLTGNVEFESAVKRFRAGDVLFCKLRPYLAKTTVATSKGVCVGELLVLRGRDGALHPNFLQFSLLSKPLVDVIDSSTYGTKMPRANWQFIGNLGYGLPPVPEQQAIADFLDGKLAEIDAFISDKRKLIDLLGEQKTAVINRAVTGGINPAAPLARSDIAWMLEIPEHWEVRRNGALFVQRNTKAGRDLPTLMVSIHTGVTVDEPDSERRKQMPQDMNSYKMAANGDIAFNKMRLWQGAVGVAPEDGLVSPDYTVAIPLPGVESQYFAHLFRTPAYKAEIDKFSHGIVRDRNRLYWAEFKQMMSPTPPYHEQQQIVRFIDDESARIDLAISKAEREIELIGEYRAALIYEAVTGKIDVREAVPAARKPMALTAQKARPEANVFFKRQVLAAEIVDRHRSVRRFGRVKLQKALILAEYHLELSDIDSEPLRAAAGPFDNAMMRSIDKQLEKQQWYRPVRRDMGYEYVPLKNCGGHKQYFSRYWDDKVAAFGELMDLIRPLFTDEIEMVATLYMAWNDFVKMGEAVDDNKIIDEVLNNWDESKKRFSREQWQAKLEWMRTNGLVPRGYGKLTKKRK